MLEGIWLIFEEFLIISLYNSAPTKKWSQRLTYLLPPTCDFLCKENGHQMREEVKVSWMPFWILFIIFTKEYANRSAVFIPEELFLFLIVHAGYAS